MQGSFTTLNSSSGSPFQHAPPILFISNRMLQRWCWSSYDVGGFWIGSSYLLLPIWLGGGPGKEIGSTTAESRQFSTSLLHHYYSRDDQQNALEVSKLEIIAAT